MSTTTKKGVNTGWIIKLIICVLIPIVIMCIPTSTAFTGDIRLFLAVSLFFISMLATSLIPMPIIALLLPVAYVIIFKHVDGIQQVAYRSWSAEIPWLMMAGFMFSNLLTKTGLVKRLSYHCISIMGGKFTGILVGLLAISTVLALVVPETMVRTVLLTTLCMGICEALELPMGSKSSAAIGLTCYLSAITPSFLFLSSSVETMLVMNMAGGASKEFVGPTFVEYLIHMFVPQLIFLVILAVVLRVFFKPDKPIDAKQKMRDGLKEMGPMKGIEKKTLFFAVLIVFGVLTTSLHGIAIGWVFVIGVAIMMLPKIELINGGDFKSINLPFVILITSCISIGNVAGLLGVTAFVRDLVMPIFEAAGNLGTLIVWGLGFVMNFILTPLAAFSTFTGSIVEIAQQMGSNTLPYLYTFIQSLQQGIIPYEWAPVLFIFGFGMIPMKRMLAFTTVKAILNLIAIPLIFMTWWGIVGIL